MSFGPWSGQSQIENVTEPPIRRGRPVRRRGIDRKAGRPPSPSLARLPSCKPSEGFRRRDGGRESSRTVPRLLPPLHATDGRTPTRTPPPQEGRKEGRRCSRQAREAAGPSGRVGNVNTNRCSIVVPSRASFHFLPAVETSFVCERGSQEREGERERGSYFADEVGLFFALPLSLSFSVCGTNLFWR